MSRLETPAQASASDGERRRWSIAWLLPLILGALVAGATLPVVLVGYMGTQDVASRLLRDRGDLLVEAVVTPIEGLLTPVSEAMDGASEALGARRGATGDPLQLGSFVESLLAANRHISGIALVSLDGSMRRWSRDGERQLLVDDDGLQFRQELITKAAEGRSGAWSSPFVSHASGEIVITYRAPMRRDGSLLGLLTASVPLNGLSPRLSGLGNEFGVVPFVLSNRLDIVAYPNMNAAPASDDTPVELPTIHSSGDDVLAAIWSAPRPTTTVKALHQAETHWTRVNERSYTYFYRELPLASDAKMVAGFYVSSSTTERERWMASIVVMIGLALLVVSILVSRLVARSLARPIVSFGDASRAVGELNFTAPDLSRWNASRISEIASTARAFSRMAAALASIRRYIPNSLMRRLIDLGDQSGRSQVREVTVLFLDLEGFTEFSRNRRATEISSYLNGIFSQAGPLVEQYGGTIDKYLGDGLMAFWGAPIEDEKHALRAVECALAIADTLSIHLRARKDVGSDGCRVRIGLHSGDVVVGDLGYEGRTDYTIVGDTVNQAKRTEESARGILPERLAVIAVTSRTISLAGVTKESHFLRELSSKQSCILERAASR